MDNAVQALPVEEGRLQYIGRQSCHSQELGEEAPTACTRKFYNQAPSQKGACKTESSSSSTGVPKHKKEAVGPRHWVATKHASVSTFVAFRMYF